MHVMVIVVFDDGNYDPDVDRYPQRAVTRGLNSCLTSENPYTTIGEKTNKQKITQTARAKVKIPRREPRGLLYFTLSICAN